MALCITNDLVSTFVKILIILTGSFVSGNSVHGANDNTIKNVPSSLMGPQDMMINNCRNETSKKSYKFNLSVDQAFTTNDLSVSPAGCVITLNLRETDNVSTIPIGNKRVGLIRPNEEVMNSSDIELATYQTLKSEKKLLKPTLQTSQSETKTTNYERGYQHQVTKSNMPTKKSDFERHRRSKSQKKKRDFSTDRSLNKRNRKQLFHLEKYDYHKRTTNYIFYTSEAVDLDFLWRKRYSQLLSQKTMPSPIINIVTNEGYGTKRYDLQGLMETGSRYRARTSASQMKKKSTKIGHIKRHSKPVNKKHSQMKTSTKDPMKSVNVFFLWMQGNKGEPPVLRNMPTGGEMIEEGDSEDAGFIIEPRSSEVQLRGAHVIPREGIIERSNPEKEENGKDDSKDDLLWHYIIPVVVTLSCCLLVVCMIRSIKKCCKKEESEMDDGPESQCTTVEPAESGNKKSSKKRPASTIKCKCDCVECRDKHQ